ncbi:hypothetical protein BH23CYA1_BH23CYA1_15160 [soil metagenome]
MNFLGLKPLASGSPTVSYTFRDVEKTCLFSCLRKAFSKGLRRIKTSENNLCNDFERFVMLGELRCIVAEPEKEHSGLLRLRDTM